MSRESKGEFYRQCSILELTTVSTLAELKVAYRRLIFQWHPDRHHGSTATYDEAVRRAQEINSAYEYLSEVLEAGLAPRAASRHTDPPGADWRAATDEYRTRHTYQHREYRAGFPDPSVVEVFVKSSNIVSVGYDRTTGALYIKFHGDRVYRYADVPLQVFEELLAAPSHGKFAHRHVYPHFKYEMC